jgi:hypothetical protein
LAIDVAQVIADFGSDIFDRRDGKFFLGREVVVNVANAHPHVFGYITHGSTPKTFFGKKFKGRLNNLTAFFGSHVSLL